MQKLQDCSDSSQIAFDSIVNSFVENLEKTFADSAVQLKSLFDFTSIEKEVREMLDVFGSSILGLLLQDAIKDEAVLKIIKTIAGRLGMHFVRLREVTVRLYNGQEVRIESPYFVKAQPKRGRRRHKPGPKSAKGEGHIGLELFGIIGLSSGIFLGDVVKLALLCPSITVAKEVLLERGISIDTKTIRRLCTVLGCKALPIRGRVSLDGTERLDGYTLVIGLDGGRLRVRRPKRGRKKNGQKRQGFHADWKEPNLFTIYLIDDSGEIVKEFKPLHDATMGRKHGVFVLLEQYLDALNITEVSRIVFCGDGDPSIWGRVETLCQKLNFDPDNIYQVLDYTHAMQNLNEIVQLLPKDLGKAPVIAKSWKDMIWQGNVHELYKSIITNLEGSAKNEGIKKWESYFLKNEKRMQYKYFKSINIPLGSGCVESAIRRVINLRLKSPGIFWKKEMAEIFLCLRSQLISGRWSIMMKNIIQLRANDAKDLGSNKRLGIQQVSSTHIV